MATPTGLIMYAGQYAVAKLLKDEDEEHFLYVGFGIGSTAATVYDIALESEIAREAATVTAIGNTQVSISGSHTVVAVNDIIEFGVFNDSAGGEMLYRGVLATADTVAVDDTEVFALTITVAQGSY